MIRKMILAAMVAVTAASAMAQAPKVTAKLVMFPAKGATSTAAAGDEFYSYSRLYTIDGAKTDAETKAGNWLIEERVAAGTTLVRVASSKPFKACVPVSGTVVSNGPCFIDDDGNGTFDRQSADEVTMFRKVKPPVPYTREPVDAMRDDSFKFVILYQGATADTLRFSYREFKNDLARAAFTEDLAVPREPFPMMMKLKGHTFEISAVSGLGVSYRMID